MLTLVDHANLKLVNRRKGMYTAKTKRRVHSYMDVNTLVGYFDSLPRFMSYLRSDMSTPQRGKASSQTGRGGSGGDFNAFESYEQALDVFTHRPHTVRGYDESDVILRDGDNAGNGVLFDVCGDYLDVGRYVEGEPECFGQVTDGNPRGRRVNLVVNCNWVCTSSHKIIAKRSRRIQRLVDWLESQQVRVSVRIVESTECGHVEILVKDHSDVLDINDVAVVSHPEFLRRLIFRFDEHSDTWQSGYGWPQCLTRELINDKKLLYPQIDSEITVFVDTGAINSIDSQFDKCEAWLSEQIHRDWTEPDQRYRIVCKQGT